MHQDSARFFARLVWQSKINAAFKMLSKDYDNGVLQLDEKVLKNLKLKHPAPADVKKRFTPSWTNENKMRNRYFD